MYGVLVGTIRILNILCVIQTWMHRHKSVISPSVIIEQCPTSEVSISFVFSFTKNKLCYFVQYSFLCRIFPPKSNEKNSRMDASYARIKDKWKLFGKTFSIVDNILLRVTPTTSYNCFLCGVFFTYKVMRKF